jgi:hypothetical protein
MRYTHYHLQRAFPTFADLVAQASDWNTRRSSTKSNRFAGIAASRVMSSRSSRMCIGSAMGILDMHRNPKHFFTALGALNNDDLIIPEWKRLAYWSGEECH